MKLRVHSLPFKTAIMVKDQELVQLIYRCGEWIAVRDSGSLFFGQVDSVRGVFVFLDKTPCLCDKPLYTFDFCPEMSTCVMLSDVLCKLTPTVGKVSPKEKTVRVVVSRKDLLIFRAFLEIRQV
jgi:hypothetical protein